MDFLFGADMPLAVRFFFAFIIVLALIGGTAFLVRRFGGQRLGASTARGRQPRLAVIDAAAVDGRRRLILIRRDNVEHLLMIGGPSDIVVEANILRASAPSRDAGQRPGQAEPRAVTAAESTMWSTQPEAPAQRAPRLDEPVMQWPVEPEPPRRAEPRVDTRPEPRAEPRSSDPLAGLAAELSRVQPEPLSRIAPEPMAPPPKMRPPPREREAPRAPQPERQAERQTERPADRQAERARAMPAAEEPAASNPDQSLADMAQRLEAALRRPRSGEPRGNEPRSPMAAPAAEPMPEAIPVSMAPDTMASHHEDEPPAAAPQPLAARRGGSPKPAPQKSVYDSLEQEMASLLGRPNAKN